MIPMFFTPEWRLAGEVLRQAMQDAQGRPGDCALTWGNIMEAWRFCTADTGE